MTSRQLLPSSAARYRSRPRASAAARNWSSGTYTHDAAGNIKTIVWTCLDGFDEIRFRLAVDPANRAHRADLYLGASEGGGLPDVVFLQTK